MRASRDAAGRAAGKAAQCIDAAGDVRPAAGRIDNGRMGRTGSVVGAALRAAARSAAWLAGEYRRDLDEPHARVSSGSCVVATACGPIDVTEAGPSGGGFAQGLVLGADDAAPGTAESARCCAAHMPGARVLGFEQGGHLLLGHQREVVAAVHVLLHAPGDNAPP